MRKSTSGPARRRAGWKLLATLLALAGAAAAVGAWVVWRGIYDVSATTNHTLPVYRLLEVAMHRAVQRRAADIPVPRLDDARLLAKGAACYRDWCVQCHGAPGQAPAPAGMSMQPLPGSLVDAGRRWTSAELYWITRNGIKMSGMPAWAFRLSEQDIWAVSAFVDQLPGISTATYRQTMRDVASLSCTTLQGACPQPPCAPQDADAAPPREESVAVLFGQYACTACHTIEGLVGSELHVGPPLQGLWRRALIAGKLPYSEEALVRWIRFPQQVDPSTAMPDLGVSEAHARQMARYLLAMPADRAQAEH